MLLNSVVSLPCNILKDGVDFKNQANVFKHKADSTILNVSLIWAR